MKSFFKIFFLYFILVYPFSLFAHNTGYGLRFKSYEVEKEKRTGLNLSPKEPLSLPDNYTFSFDIKVDSAIVYPFGYVFRMISDEGKHIDFLFNEDRNTGLSKFVLTHSAKELFSDMFRAADIRYKVWTSISITINSTEKRLIAQIGSSSFEQKIEDLDSFRNVNIIFGKSDFPGLSNIDIPTMVVKNIKITEGNNKLLYHWLLNKHTKDGVYDEIRQHFAQSENPAWVIDQHVFWEKNASVKTKLKPMIAYNKDNSEIAIYDQNSFFRYNLTTNRLKEHKLNQGAYNATQSNNLIFNSYFGKYIYYTFQMEEEKDVLLFDTSQQKWNIQSDVKLPTDFWHHNHIISSTDSCLYLFGGYGHHKYKNDVRIYDFATKEWQRTHFNGDSISPRYLSSLGKIDDSHVLIFGGYGNQTGNQELSTQYFYDLYKVNLKTLTSEKLWILNAPSSDFVVANSMIIDTARNSFYTLAFPFQQFNTKLALLRFSLDKPEYEVLGDSISLNFEDTKSFVDLYLNKHQDKDELVAVISSISSISDSVSTVSIYTLANSPLTKKDIYQSEISDDTNRYAYIFLFVLLITIIIIARFSISKRRQQKALDNKKNTSQTSSSYDEDKFRTSPIPLGKELKSQSIYLFGGFCVVDKQGNDISKEFTPMLKHLFILILLYTYKERRGISSIKLKEILWFDKSEESAKNNRGVSISKLRVIFEMVGEVSIKNNKSHWTVEFGDQIYCDYLQALYLMRKIETNKSATSIEDIHHLLKIVSTGELLPNLQEEWIDSFKSDFSNDLIDLLLAISKFPILEDSPHLYIELADAIFIHDSLSEEALQLKCSILVKMGRNGLAQKAYNSFVKEYKQLFDTDFSRSFEQIINPDDTL